MRGEALHVDFVNDELLEPQIWRTRSLPVEGVVNNDRFRYDSSVVATVEDALPRAGLRIVGEEQVVGVAKLRRDRFRVWVEEQLGVVESQSPFRTVFTANL